MHHKAQRGKREGCHVSGSLGRGAPDKILIYGDRKSGAESKRSPPHDETKPALPDRYTKPARCGLRLPLSCDVKSRHISAVSLLLFFSSSFHFVLCMRKREEEERNVSTPFQVTIGPRADAVANPDQRALVT